MSTCRSVGQNPPTKLECRGQNNFATRRGEPRIMAMAAAKVHENGKGVRELTTICGFCGVGCGLSITVEDGVITKVAGDKENPSSKGEACIKGREVVPASWDEALDLVASKMGEIKDEHGPDAFGLFSSSRSTNELNYLASKFVRQVLGNSNIDSCNRA